MMSNNEKDKVIPSLSDTANTVEGKMLWANPEPMCPICKGNAYWGKTLSSWERCRCVYVSTITALQSLVTRLEAERDAARAKALEDAAAQAEAFANDEQIVTYFAKKRCTVDELLHQCTKHMRATARFIAEDIRFRPREMSDRMTDAEINKARDDLEYAVKSWTIEDEDEGGTMSRALAAITALQARLEAAERKRGEAERLHSDAVKWVGELKARIAELEMPVTDDEMVNRLRCYHTIGGKQSEPLGELLDAAAVHIRRLSRQSKSNALLVEAETALREIGTGAHDGHAAALLARAILSKIEHSKELEVRKTNA